MAAMNSDERERYENDIEEATGISYDEFCKLNAYYRLEALEKIKNYNELHLAIAAYKELLGVGLISDGAIEASPSLVTLDIEIKEMQTSWHMLDKIQQVRELTNNEISIKDCKKALVDCSWYIDIAVVLLKRRFAPIG
jgi:hypothetical protein